MRTKSSWLIVAVVALPAMAGCDKKSNDTHGATTTTASTAAGGTIKLGQTMPFSGPASAYGVIGRTHAAYFKMVNEEKGGVNGRKIELVSLDDGYNPAKTVEQTRKLVESENILADFGSVGTAPAGAVHAYLNERKVPQIFVSTGGEKWADPKFPWTIGWQPSYRAEAKMYGKYIDETKPGAKVCMLYQNDDFGKDFLAGLKEAFGNDYDKKMVKTVSYEVTDPTVDSQITSLQASGCDAVILGATPKFAAQAIRKVFDLGWKPLEILANVSVSITSVLKPAGLDKSTGLVTGAYLKDPSDPKLASDPGLADYRAFMKKYMPESDVNDANSVYAFGQGITMVKVLEQCGADVTRENIMKQALALVDVPAQVTLTGIDITTGPTDFHPIAKMQLARFNGTSFELFGRVLSSE